MFRKVKGKDAIEVKQTLGIIISDSKLTVLGFSISEAFEYVEKIWEKLKKEIPESLWSKITVEVSGISNLGSKMSFKWSVTIDTNGENEVFEDLLLMLTENNFFVKGDIEII